MPHPVPGQARSAGSGVPVDMPAAPRRGGHTDAAPSSAATNAVRAAAVLLPGGPIHRQRPRTGPAAVARPHSLRPRPNAAAPDTSPAARSIGSAARLKTPARSRTTTPAPGPTASRRPRVGRPPTLDARTLGPARTPPHRYHHHPRGGYSRRASWPAQRRQVTGVAGTHTPARCSPPYAVAASPTPHRPACRCSPPGQPRRAAPPAPRAAARRPPGPTQRRCAPAIVPAYENASPCPSVSGQPHNEFVAGRRLDGDRSQPPWSPFIRGDKRIRQIHTITPGPHPQRHAVCRLVALRNWRGNDMGWAVATAPPRQDHRL